MGERRRPCAAAIVAAFLLVAVVPAAAAPAPAPSGQAPAAATSSPAATAPPPDGADALARAKELFRQGTALYEAGAYDRALEAFRASRALVPSVKNTINAALCLERLERFDEALELYEETIGRFRTQIDDASRAGATAAVARLGARVASLEVSSNVEGTLLVDGRPRGRLPLTSALRILPGRHVVRVLNDGYATFEQAVDLAAGERRTVDARLEALVAAGGLHVEDTGLSGADVLVDGAVVGTAPWEGTLAPGPHVVQTRKDGRGSAPILAVVVERQTTLLRVPSAVLGPTLVVEVTPPSAEIVVDGVAVAHGRWSGELPRGRREVVGREEGYVSARAVVDVGGPSSPRARVPLVLDRDPLHPRWPRPPAGHLWASAFFAYAVGPSLRSGAEQSCGTGCANRGPATGPVAGIRVGYAFPVPLSLELGGGFVSMESDVRRTYSEGFTSSAGPASVRYDVRDTVRLKGGLLTASVSYARAFSARWALRSRIGAGLLLATSSDTLAATATGDGRRTTATIDGSGTTVSSTVPLVTSELAVTFSLGAVRVGVGATALFSPSRGSALPTGSLSSTPSCTASAPAAPGCAPATNALIGERAYGPFALIAPEVLGEVAF